MTIKDLTLICLLLIFGYTLFAGEKIKASIFVDGVQREYYLHIPLSYSAQNDVPLVFMLHGTGGDGEKMYESSGWAELAENEGFIAAFPSSLRYKIIDYDTIKTTTKRNITPDAGFTFFPGVEGKDDIKFLRLLIDKIMTEYNIDGRRIYLNGFSNGGAMAARCAVEMSDVLAAVAANAGSFEIDTVYIPKRKLPVIYQVGNKDYGPGNEGPEAPMKYFDSLISYPNTYRGGKLYETALRYTTNFEYKTEHTISGDSSRALVARYLPQEDNADREFLYIFVKGLGHSYPNWAPTFHWDWMKKFQLPTTSAFTLTVQNGYGSGQYQKGDIQHIWAEQQDGKVFSHWTGDIEFLESSMEYHTRLTMPNKNITIAAKFATLSSDQILRSITIRGENTDKNVFYFLPENASTTKGVAWFFHGTNGNAANMTFDPDTRQLINLLITKGYGIIAITSEESETQTDFNGDGVYRWSYGVDSNLIDIANVRLIRDKLIEGGLIKSNTPHIAIGWSAGGAFTEFVANTLGWKSAINHTSSGNEQLSLSAQVKVPYLVSMNENDRHPDVGQQANNDAKNYVKNYIDRGACAVYHLHTKSPLYPERFDRSPFITTEDSRKIYNELQSNNLIDANGFIIGLATNVKLAIANNPSNFPFILGLSQMQRDAAVKQIEVINAEHSFKADINGMTIQFIEKACGIDTHTDDQDLSNALQEYPNPGIDIINIKAPSSWKIYSMCGIEMMFGQGEHADISQLPSGLYVIKSENRAIKWVKL